MVLALAALLVVAAAWFLYTPDKPRAALEAKYAPPPSTFIDVEGVRLHVRDTGPRTAPALILLHGFASSLHTWEGWATPLEADHRVIRIDLPGFGLTGPDPSGDYTDERAIQVIEALMDRLGVARATMVGNSMGGRIAWRFAVERPGRVEKLVLVSPDGFASPGIAYGRKTEIPAMMRALSTILPTFFLRMNLAPSYADPSRLSDAVVARYRDMMLVPGVRKAILARMEQHVLPDPARLLPHIQAPTLLLWGAKDAMIPVVNAADYKAAIPNATVVLLPTLGHVPQEEAPAESLTPVKDFLAS